MIASPQPKTIIVAIELSTTSFSWAKNTKRVRTG